MGDLRPHGLTGSKLEKITDAVSITLNRNAVHGDASALSPGGVRVGMPAMTTRGCKEEDSKQIGEFLHRCCNIAIKIQESHGKKLKDFETGVDGNAATAGAAAAAADKNIKFSIWCPQSQPYRWPRSKRQHWLSRLHLHAPICAFDSVASCCGSCNAGA